MHASLVDLPVLEVDAVRSTGRPPDRPLDGHLLIRARARSAPSVSEGAPA